MNSACGCPFPTPMRTPDGRSPLGTFPGCGGHPGRGPASSLTGQMFAGPGRPRGGAPPRRKVVGGVLRAQGRGSPRGPTSKNRLGHGVLGSIGCLFLGVRLGLNINQMITRLRCNHAEHPWQCRGTFPRRRHTCASSAMPWYIAEEAPCITSSSAMPRYIAKEARCVASR